MEHHYRLRGSYFRLPTVEVWSGTDVLKCRMRCAATKPWKVTKPKPVGLCYDCDYDPDDAQVKPGEKVHWNSYGQATTTPAAAGYSGRRGFPRCALDRGDERFVRVTECHSSICFIRRDHNGRQYSIPLLTHLLFHRFIY